MAKFSEGDKVVNVNTNEKGIIIRVLQARRGRQFYRVKYDDRENDENSIYLQNDVDLTDPFERIKQNIFGQYTEYLKGNTAFKIKSSNNSTISSLKASKTLFKPYQFKPLLKFLNSDSKRLLIADEVGLGKTIEAGHIMLELKARGELRNALVVCPMALRTKWATELTEKFGLNFMVIEKKEDLIHAIQFHNGHVRAVVNYDKIRQGSDIIEYIKEKRVKFSIIVCDESHKLRNSSTQTYNGAKDLLQFADGAVFMSATPIMIDETNLYNQLKLLDENTYYREEVFLNNNQLNKPFVRALSSLNEGKDLNLIADELSSSSVYITNIIDKQEYRTIENIDNYFSSYPIYKEIIQDLRSGDNTQKLRAKIQYNLSEMNPMNKVFSRTRKREVTQDWSQAERNPRTVYESLTSDEVDAYDEAIDDYVSDHTYYDEYGRERNGALGQVTLKRQLASSVWACKSNESKLDIGFDEFADYKDAKFDALLKILETVFSNGNSKIIIFAIFRKTLKYLNIRLAKAGYKSVMIYGNSKINRNDVLNQFQFDKSVQVLLSSEVGSEGLDMQFCNSMVNYDLPWNPMVVEQRIGRIDRFGQKSPKVNIYNIIVKNSILEDIYSRLLNRIGIFKESIGDLEAILDAEMIQDGKKMTIQEALKDMERDFYSDKLTTQEAERKREEIENAIETEKLNLKKIEEGLTNTLTNDSYFRDEINKILKNNAYVTSNELRQFVVQIIKEHLTTCSLEETDDPLVYEFSLSRSDPKALIKFLTYYRPQDDEGRKIFNDYIYDIEGMLTLKVTFDQEKAFNDKSISFLNIYHPIIRAGVSMFEEKSDKYQNTFFFELSSENLPPEIKSGMYILGIYKISNSRMVFGKPTVTDSLYPVLYDVSNNSVVADQDISERFMGRAQVDGHYSPFGDSLKLSADEIEDIRYDMKDAVDIYLNEMREDLKKRIENSKKQRFQQTEQYYIIREESLRRVIKNYEDMREMVISSSYTKDDKRIREIDGVLRLQKSNLSSLLLKKEEELDKINQDVQLKITDEIKSINYVRVI